MHRNDPHLALFAVLAMRTKNYLEQRLGAYELDRTSCAAVVHLIFTNDRQTDRRTCVAWRRQLRIECVMLFNENVLSKVCEQRTLSDLRKIAFYNRTQIY